MIKELLSILGNKQFDEVVSTLVNLQKNAVVYIDDFTIAPLLASTIKSPFVYVSPTREGCNNASIVFENLGLKTIVCAVVPDMPLYTENTMSGVYGLVNFISKFNNGECDVFILYAPVLLSCIPCKSSQTLKLSVNEKIKLKTLVETFDSYGYERVQSVETVGQYSMRGDVVDYYPENSPHPVRIMFFGDTIEKIKFFSI